MQRRTVVMCAAIVLAGCNRGDSEPDDSHPGGAQRVGPTPDDSELPEVRGDWLEAKSDSDLEVSDHVFHYTGERTQPFVVTGTVVQSSGERATVKVSVNFLDKDGTVIHDNYDLLTDLESGQEAEFTIQYAGDAPKRVDDYELIAEIR